MKKFFLIITLTSVVASKELCAMLPSALAITNGTSKDLTALLHRTDSFQNWQEGLDELKVSLQLTLPPGQKKVFDLYLLTRQGEELQEALAIEASIDSNNSLLIPHQKIEGLLILLASRVVKTITEDDMKRSSSVTVTNEDLEVSDVDQ